MCADVPRRVSAAGKRAESATAPAVYRLVQWLSRTGRPEPDEPESSRGEWWAARPLLMESASMRRCVWMLGLLLAPVAGADELAPRTRTLLHQALEARLTLPTDPPSLQRPVLPPSPRPSAAASRQSTTAATQSAQAAAANQAAQNVANGRSRVSEGGEGSEATQNAAGQARAVEARATGGDGASHGKGKPPDTGKPPGKPGK